MSFPDDTALPPPLPHNHHTAPVALLTPYNQHILIVVFHTMRCTYTNSFIYIYIYILVFEYAWVCVHISTTEYFYMHVY